MIRKSEYFEQTDKFLNSEMTVPELKEFESQLGVDSELADELSLQMDVEESLTEMDVVSLRSHLSQIVHNQADAANEISVFDSFSFGLSEEFSSRNKLGTTMNPEDIFNFGHTFPQIHLYQHKVAGKENIHQFYKEQFDSESVSEEAAFTAIDEGLFTEVQNALEESDIFDLRANLSQISHTLPAHGYSTEEIEDYINDRMDTDIRAQFEEELAFNASLAKDLRLLSEIEIAGSETDIMSLRATLTQIQKSELQAPVSIENIENYLSGVLSEAELASFEEELTSNNKLQQEIELIKNIDLAIRENDVMQLRGRLHDIAGQISSEKRTERSLAGKFKVTRTFVISSVAASLILLLGITGLLTRHSSDGELYRKYYSRYETAGIVRSGGMNTDQTLMSAMQKFDNQEYESAINLFNEVIARNGNNMAGHFYSGVSSQETGKYQDAIDEYETVIKDNDNLFIEQAQWYIGLCYLQTNDNRKAVKQFRKIAKVEGYYRQNARDILRKLRTAEE